jgi:gamma-carbonic anhydrase
MPIFDYLKHMPEIDPSATIFPGAVVAGEVKIGARVNVWYNATIRGDMANIEIGDDTNIQDNAVIHVNTNTPTLIGKFVTIGHGAIVHGATVGDHALIGMGSILLDHSVVEAYAMVAAGCLVPPGKVVPEGMLAVGNPMKIVRPLTEEEKEHNKKNVLAYVQLADSYEK